MTWLPILERELRMRARSRSNYWGRLGVGMIGMMIGVPPLVWSNPWDTPATIGHGVFIGIVSAAFLLSCAACLATADSISAERREGTLGLLFLTRVKGFDVLVGKFASNGMTCLFALLAFLPVLMIPVLAGGVTGGEVFRKGMILLETSFVALSAGLWASARGYERFKTARTALLLVSALVLIPSLTGWIVPHSNVELLSPLGGMGYAADRPFQRSPGHYWLSLGLVQSVGWGLLFAAIVSLRAHLRSGEDGPTFRPLPAARSRQQPSAQTIGDAEPPIAPPEGISSGEVAVARTRGGEPWSGHSHGPTPLHWLLRRRPGMKAIVWCAAAVTFLQYAFYGVSAAFGRGWGGSYLGLHWSVNLVIAGISGSLLAWAASRFFVEARHNGELELLLTTPLGAKALISAQWDVLKKLIRWPVVVMAVPMILQGVFIMMMLRGSPWNTVWKLYYAGSLLLGAINMVASVVALCWLGLWFGLRAEGQARAILWTVGLARGVPYAQTLICAALYKTLFHAPATPNSAGRWILSSLLPQLVSLALYVWLIHVGRRQAVRELL
jgi:ABC-type transport system involved in cytochrome c biogenesis permease component